MIINVSLLTIPLSHQMDMDLRGESKPIVVIIGHEVSRRGLFEPRQTCNDLLTDRSLTEGICDKTMGLKSKV